VNLVLFEQDELARPLPAGDPRARHVLDVLRRTAGGTFDCGLVDGPRGQASIAHVDPAGLHLDFTWAATPPDLPAIWLLIGLPRPQTARKILVEATTLGARHLIFFATDRSEPSYAGSRLWTSGEVRRHLIAGAAQAFCTRLPQVFLEPDLARALPHLPPEAARVALDNYESTRSLSAVGLPAGPAVLAVGGERGWSGPERIALRAAGFELVDLGPRVLRTETACSAGLTLLLAKTGQLGMTPRTQPAAGAESAASE
jgi:RsmE family RNA methyltransferase